MNTALQTPLTTLFRCGIGLDSWMLPLYREPEDSTGSSLSQPFYFINAYTFQWKDNVLKMMSLCDPLDASGKSQRRILTLEWVLMWFLTESIVQHTYVRIHCLWMLRYSGFARCRKCQNVLEPFDGWSNTSIPFIGICCRDQLFFLTCQLMIQNLYICGRGLES